MGKVKNFIELSLAMFSLIFAFNLAKPNLTNAVNTACKLNDCATTADCTPCCPPGNCTANCVKTIDPDTGKQNQTGTCKWTVGNTCTDWGDWGPCVNFCQTRTCKKGHDFDLQVQSCGGGDCVDQGGGPSCPNGPYQWECRQASNCDGNEQDGVCGYDKNGNKKYYCTRTFCNTCPSCNTTAPSNVAVTAVSPSSTTIKLRLRGSLLFTRQSYGDQSPILAAGEGGQVIMVAKSPIPNPSPNDGEGSASSPLRSSERVAKHG